MLIGPADWEIPSPRWCDRRLAAVDADHDHEPHTIARESHLSCIPWLELFLQERGVSLPTSLASGGFLRFPLDEIRRSLL